MRSASSPPATAPMASTATIVPQPAAPLRCSFATVGPSTSRAGKYVSWNNPNEAMIATTQGREMNSRQPSRRSPTIDEVAARTVPASRIDAMNRADTKNVAASKAIAIAGLPRVTIRAPSAGDAIESVLRESCASAFACWRWASLTVSLISPIPIGLEKALATPNATCSSAMFQTCAAPENSSTAVATWAEPFTRSVPIRIVRRGIRSAKTPPSSRKTIIGISRARSTIPRSVGVPNPRTANARATFAMPFPSWLTTTDPR